MQTRYVEVPDFLLGLHSLLACPFLGGVDDLEIESHEVNLFLDRLGELLLVRLEQVHREFGESRRFSNWRCF